MAEQPSDDSYELRILLLQELLGHEWEMTAMTGLEESDLQPVAEPQPLDEGEEQAPAGLFETIAEFEETENSLLFGTGEDTGNFDLIHPSSNVSIANETAQAFPETSEREDSFDFTQGASGVALLEEIEEVSRSSSWQSFASQILQTNQAAASQTQQANQTAAPVPYSSQTQQANQTADLVPYSSQTQQANQPVALVTFRPSQDQQINQTVAHSFSSQTQQTNQTVGFVSYPSSQTQQRNQTVTRASYPSSQTQQTNRTVGFVSYPSSQTQQRNLTITIESYSSSSQTQQTIRTVTRVQHHSTQTQETNQTVAPLPHTSSQTQQTIRTVTRVLHHSTQTQETSQTVAPLPHTSSQTQQTNRTTTRVPHHSTQTQETNQTVVPLPHTSSQTQQTNRTVTRVSTITQDSSSERLANETLAALPGTSSPQENEVVIIRGTAAPACEQEIVILSPCPVEVTSTPGHTNRVILVNNPGSLPALHNTQNVSQSDRDGPAPESSAVQGPTEEEAEYTCQICHIKKADKQEMKDHLEMHKNSIKLRCKLCGRRYISAGTLRRHLVRGHNLSEGARLNENQCYFACKECGEKFNSREHYTSHLQAHISDYTFKCDKCSCSYPVPSHLISHKVHAHQELHVGSLESR